MSRFMPLFADPLPTLELAGDPTPYIAYGLQRLVPSYNGPLVTLRESVGNTQQTFYPLENGRFPVLPALAFQGAGSLFVVTWSDQGSGGFDATQATAALQPQLDLVHAALNNRPAILFGDASNVRLTTTGTPNSFFGVGGFFSFVADFTANPTNLSDKVFFRTSAQVQFAATSSIAPKFTQTTGGTWSPSASIGTGGHVVDVLYSSSSTANVATLGVDGTNPSQTNVQPSGIVAESGTLTVGNLNTGVAGFPGYIAEMIFYQVQPSTAEITVLRARQKVDFNTP